MLNIVNSDVLPDVNIEKRVLARLNFQENKKQQNIEHITQSAAAELQNETTVSKEKVDEDWITRNFRIAEDISSDKIQLLWGKILAGEVKTPGSFSLRTLEILKNISQSDAELFGKFCKYAIISGKMIFVINTNSGEYLKKELGFNFKDYLLLRELDLLAPNDLSFQLQPSEVETKCYFFCGTTCLSLERSVKTPLQQTAVILFTEVGKQLYNLIEKQMADIGYLKKVASLFISEGIAFKYAQITERRADSFEHTEFVDLDISNN